MMKILAFFALIAAVQCQDSSLIQLFNQISSLSPEQQLAQISQLSSDQLSQLNQYQSLQQTSSQLNQLGQNSLGQTSSSQNSLSLLNSLNSQSPSGSTGFNPYAGSSYPSQNSLGSLGSLSSIGSASSLGSLGSLYSSGSSSLGLLNSLNSGSSSSLGGLSGGLGQSLFQSSCQDDCEDNNKFLCSYMRNKCNSGTMSILFKQACPYTCGICRPCSIFARSCVADDSCVDKNENLCKFLLAPTMCNSGKFAGAVRDMCPVSCLQCAPCPVPKVIETPKCSKDCKDDKPSCERWAKLNYCEAPSKYSPWMKENCKKSCRACTYCVPPPAISEPDIEELLKSSLPSSNATSKLPDGATDQGTEPNQASILNSLNLLNNYKPSNLNNLNSVDNSDGLENLDLDNLNLESLAEFLGVPSLTNTLETSTSEATEPSGPSAQLNTVTTSNKKVIRKSDIDAERRDCHRVDDENANAVEQCLNSHNYYRCLHGAQPLSYDNQLARTAQAYANRLARDGSRGITSMNPSRIGYARPRGVGENLASNRQEGKKYDVKEAVADWYAEGLMYDYDAQAHSYNTAHFSQVIWKDTKSVGCGIEKVGHKIYVVAHYRSSGNSPGHFLQEVPRPSADVCQANCGLGSCQRNEKSTDVNNNNEDCVCDAVGTKPSLPTCTGRCVVNCPRPKNYRGYWQTSCEGSQICSCNDRGDVSRNIWPGAWCY
ncbi:uncharacterized protein LOC143465995 [Clavelina lepadiformis]|uniref:uncharacterized protein LOC143465995 n=1 Tax=Clavelina lepadiformis TaxID=159417 RepID=UPI004043446F